VRAGLAVVHLHDVVAEPPLTFDAGADGGPEATLDGWPDYLEWLAEDLGPGAFVGEAEAVADLDAVADDAWPDVLAYLASDPQARAALLTPVRAAGRQAPSYTAWWLRDLFDAPFAVPGADVPFLPPAPALLGDPADAALLDPEVLAAVGAVGDLGGLDAEGWARYLDHLPKAGSVIPMGVALAVWRGLAAAAEHLDGAAAHPPERVPVLRLPRSTTGEAGTGGGGSGPDPRVAVVVPADDAAVAAEPMWAQVADVVPAPAAVAGALADLLDVDVLEGEAEIAGGGREVATPPEVLALLPGAPATWWEHDDLTADGTAVEWWVVGGVPHASTTAGLARAVAQAAGRWAAHAAVELVLADPDRAAELAADLAWGS
jgi:hypothetical protein